MTTGDVTVLSGLLDLGPYGLAVGAVLALWRMHMSAIARERSTTDYERSRADRAESAMREQVIPVLTKAQAVLSRFAEDADRRGRSR